MTTPEPTPPDADWEQQLIDRMSRALRQIRTKRGISAYKLADLTEGAITHATIANIESRKKRPINVAELLVLAEALEVAPLALIYPDAPDTVVTTPGGDMTTAEAVIEFAGYYDGDISKKAANVDNFALHYRLTDSRVFCAEFPSPEHYQTLQGLERQAAEWDGDNDGR